MEEGPAAGWAGSVHHAQTGMARQRAVGRVEVRPHPEGKASGALGRVSEMGYVLSSRGMRQAGGVRQPWLCAGLQSTQWGNEVLNVRNC